jgi:hypothetical protein
MGVEDNGYLSGNLHDHLSSVRERKGDKFGAATDLMWELVIFVLQTSGFGDEHERCSDLKKWKKWKSARIHHRSLSFAGVFVAIILIIMSFWCRHFSLTSRHRDIRTNEIWQISGVFLIKGKTMIKSTPGFHFWCPVANCQVFWSFFLLLIFIRTSFSTHFEGSDCSFSDLDFCTGASYHYPECLTIDYPNKMLINYQSFWRSPDQTSSTECQPFNSWQFRSWFKCNWGKWSAVREVRHARLHLMQEEWSQPSPWGRMPSF